MDPLGLFLAFLIIFLITTFIAGIYQAFYSKKFQPAAIFQNRYKLRRAGTASVILNAVQFMLSIMVLAGGMIFLKNEVFIHSLGLGYENTILKLDTGEMEIRFLKITEAYLDMMQVQLNQGRCFNKNDASDYSDVVIANQAFVLLLGISVLAGIVLSYFFTDYLLCRVYEYHTSVSYLILFTSGFVVFFLALFTTSSTIYKAAIINPSKILRSE